MIYVIRHGATRLNSEGRLQGRDGEPLNELGVQQAKDLSDKLKGVKFDCVFSSPQQRAVQTAFIATGITPTIDNRLDVFDLGSADRLKKDEVSYALGGFIPDPTKYVGVENPKAYFERVFSFLNDISKDSTMKDKNILICGHKCTTACIACYFKGMPKIENVMDYSLKNGEFATYNNESYNEENNHI